MKGGRRLRRAGWGSRAGDAGEAGAWEAVGGAGWGTGGLSGREEAGDPAGTTRSGLLTVYSRLSAHRQFLEHEKPPHTIVARGLAGARGSGRPPRGWAGCRWVLASWDSGLARGSGAQARGCSAAPAAAPTRSATCGGGGGSADRAPRPAAPPRPAL